MLGPCSSDALIGTIGTILSLVRAKSVLFESLGRLRSREYLEPCYLHKIGSVHNLLFNIGPSGSCCVY